MRIEFHEKIQDIDPDELDKYERMGIEFTDKRFKWRRVCVLSYEIAAFYEVTKSETIIEFKDQSQMTVKGSYDQIKAAIIEVEKNEEKEFEEAGEEEAKSTQ